MQAIILAGGEGTRLRPYTTVLPKPLVPVGEHPIAEIIVRQLKRDGFDRIVFAVHHLAELIQAFFGDGKRWGVTITYSRETRPLGTAGPIGLVEPLDESFLVMNGDVLTTLDYRALMEAHRAHGGIATLTTCRKEVPVSLGVVEVSPERTLTGYTEKPTLHYQVSMGIYVLSRRVTGLIPRDRPFDLPDLMKALVERGETVHCHEVVDDWFHLTRPEDFERVQTFERDDVSRFLRGTPNA